MKDEDLIKEVVQYATKSYCPPRLLTDKMTPLVAKFREEAVKEALGAIMEQSPTKGEKTVAQPKLAGLLKRLFGKKGV